MKFTATKNYSLEVIGDIKLKFDLKGRKPKGKVILAKNLDYFSDRMSIDIDTENMLRKEMKRKGSDLLTDGRFYYTLFGSEIGRIGHSQFEKELELHKELFGFSL